MGRHFTIYNDQRPLVKLFDFQQTTLAIGAAEIQRWSINLSNFNNHVEYRKNANTKMQTLPNV